MYNEEYRKMYQVEEALWWYQSLHEIVISKLAQLIKPHSHILDAGCGTGKMMEKLIKTGYKVDGFDLSPRAISFCKKRGIDSVKKASIVAIPYPDNTYDAVVMLDVLPFIELSDVPRAITELHRVLKKRGYCIIHAAALEALRSDHDEVCNMQHRYTIPEIRALFSSKKWRHLYFSYRLFLLFVPIALIKLLKQYKRLFYKTPPVSDLHVPQWMVNNFLGLVMKVEDAALFKVSFPFGTSTIAILQKK